MMSKKDLEIIVERIPRHPNPKYLLEQYTTPGRIVAEVVHMAKVLGDLDGSIVVDLGCGTGRFAIASALYGASYSVGVDVDIEALLVARKYSKILDVNSDFILSDVKLLRIRGDVVMQNPPFGSRIRHMDRIFLEKAMETANIIYTIHDFYSRDYVVSFLERKGFKVTHIIKDLFEIPNQFAFHRSRIRRVKVCIIRAESL
ncbi:MAG: RNA methyltransferase [Thermoplasmata archaeon]|nr:MAG: RNA methyltransferase [Thermoplasmata archaeon]